MAGCTNEKPCGKPVLRWVHSAVCQRLTAQGKVAREPAAPAKPGEGKRRVPIAGGGALAIESARLADRELAEHFASAAEEPKTGCGCGQVLLPRSWWSRQPQDGWVDEDGVRHRYSATCVRPERAGREGDQPLPVPGGESVFAEVRRRLDEREATGVRRYGVSLQTFNGRDAGRDLEDELLDALAYATQQRLQHAALVEALLALGKLVRLACDQTAWKGYGRGSLTPKERAALELVEKLEVARGR